MFGQILKDRLKKTKEGIYKATEFASQDLAQERYEICKSCEYFNVVSKTCKKCGCFMVAKTKLLNTSCPMNKW